MHLNLRSKAFLKDLLGVLFITKLHLQIPFSIQKVLGVEGMCLDLQFIFFFFRHIWMQSNFQEENGYGGTGRNKARLFGDYITLLLCYSKGKKK